jgi:hypothetical protein
MTNVKGQNLRILVGDDINNLRCVAAALTSTLHASLEVAEATTKDNEDDWIENEPVGVNWDLEAQSVVVDGVTMGKGITNNNIGTISSQTVYGAPSSAIELPAGKAIAARCLNYSDAIYITLSPPVTSALASGTGEVLHKNTGSSTLNVLVATHHSDAVIEYFISDIDATSIDELQVGKEYTLAFALTHGSKNRQTGSITPGAATASTRLVQVAPIQYWGASSAISLPAGMSITARTLNHKDLVIVTNMPPVVSDPIIAQGDNGQVTFTNTGDSSMSINIGCPYQDEPMDFYIHDGSILQVIGKAILNDFNITAANQQESTAQVRFTGNGELVLLG